MYSYDNEDGRAEEQHRSFDDSTGPKIGCSERTLKWGRLSRLASFVIRLSRNRRALVNISSSKCTSFSTNGSHLDR